MAIFNATLCQTLMMFVLLLVGFCLRKLRILPENAHITMSRLETFVFVPALNLFTQMTQCTVQTFRENAFFILGGLALICCALSASYPLSRLFIKKRESSPDQDYQRSIYKYAMTFGNFGFMGNFLVLGIWGDAAFYRYSLFTLCIALVCNTWGLFILIPKEQGSGFLRNLKRGILTPPTVALFLGMLLGLLNANQYVPDFLTTALSKAGDCMGPVSMVLAGFVIGGYSFRDLLCNKKVYGATAVRLLLIPAILLGVLKVIGMGEEFMTFALIAFATPLGLNTIIYPAAYGGDTKTGASMAMISHTLSVITIPVMYLLFIAFL